MNVVHNHAPYQSATDTIFSWPKMLDSNQRMLAHLLFSKQLPYRSVNLRLVQDRRVERLHSIWKIDMLAIDINPASVAGAGFEPTCTAYETVE